MCLRASRDLLQQKASDYRQAYQQALLAEAQALAVEYLAEFLWEIDGLLQEFFSVPQLRLILPPSTPTHVVEAVSESLRQRAVTGLKEKLREDREVTRARAQRANRQRSPAQLLDKPVVTTVSSAVGPIAPKPDRPILPLHGTR
jgi:hypothetical protein